MTRIDAEVNTLQVGKSGLSDGVVHEMDAQLEREGILKLRLLRSAPEIGRMKDAIREAALKLKAEVVDIRGHTATLRRKPGMKVLRPEKE